MILFPRPSPIRVPAKTSAGQESYFQQNDPHPDPLPSDGRGNSQTRPSQFPKRLDTPPDGGRFSLACRASKRNSRSVTAFTLIELLVVIAIIAILAARKVTQIFNLLYCGFA